MNELNITFNQLIENKRKCKSIVNCLEIHCYKKGDDGDFIEWEVDHDIVHFMDFIENEEYKEKVSIINIQHSIQDEWFIINKLIEFSKNNNVIFEVFDEDGQLILAECSEYLPSYITPENDSHKVFIKNGSIYFNELTYINPFLMHNDCCNEEITKKILNLITKHAQLFSIHNTIGFLPIQIANFLNIHNELFGIIINKFINNDINLNNEFPLEYGKSSQCQLKMKTLQFNRYYNYILQNTENQSYQEVLGKMILIGFSHLLNLNQQSSQYHFIPQYTKLFDEYCHSEESKRISSPLIEDSVSEVKIEDLIEDYKEILEQNELESILKDDITDVIGIDSDINGFVTKSDGLLPNGNINTTNFDKLFDEFIEDLKSPSSSEDETDEENDQLIDQLTHVLNQTKDINDTPLTDSLQQDTTATTSTLFSNSVK
ncbi:hypothetical protein EDI_182710 [Entamoeba dispar SAW760]|uniref:Uncharacterized protein n=1 Tax=Entamoeba dispar (strain ATCC PRA-260 / SAW760) TaxID=370354 RepID=B0EQ27_ENTDS|nr:uncharacterized protein EDI_182710 [Entamoeba dispar SAW760]EDR23374.1 hypothetical protein EDI_182710 [Entamoeba dispar SAW760]|eukprot:EDR23374.1 hypothetical protein EDI_182710 [Entamoeba dispar SAW760]